MSNKEQLLKNLLKNILEDRLKRLEIRNIEQMKDLKIEKESYNKQSMTLKKIKIIKIEPKKRSKRNTDILSTRIRDKTPKNVRTKTKSLLNNNYNYNYKKDNIRSKTPITTLHKKRHEPKGNKPKENKDKDNKDKIRSRTPIKTSKKPPNLHNLKISSHFVQNSMNMNKQKKVGDKSNKSNIIVRKAITPDIRTKNKFKISNKKKPTAKKENSNLNLIDIKTENLNEYIIIDNKTPKKKEELKEQMKKDLKEPLKNAFKEEEKKEEIKKEEIKKEETKKEEIKKEEIKKEKEIIGKKICVFDPILGHNKLINKISSYLDDNSQFNFFSCNKQLIKYLYEKLMTSLEQLKFTNKLTFSSTIQDQINDLRLNYQNDQLNAETPQFTLSKGTVKAIEILNDENYNKIFKNIDLAPPLNEIILVYRIFFQLLNNNNIYKIKNDKLFWKEASEFILKHSNGKTGEFFKDSTNNFDFSTKNIYKIKQIVNGNEDKIKPTVFSKVCATTGLVIFLIKDSLEYIGIIHNIKKNIPSLMLKYLIYIGDIQNKTESYINNLKKLNNNI